jgi:predicted Fe-Mo cluster-binding NifX family protein
MIDLSSSVYDVIKIPVYLPDINGNYATVDLVIRFNDNQKSKENTIIEFCKKHSVDVVGCNSIKEQAFKTIADAEKNMLQSYID